MLPQPGLAARRSPRYAMKSSSRPDPDEPIACSVLMPVLNEEDHIEASVAAMAAQEFPGRLEFLIVDGGSTDRTPELLRELAARDSRIRVLANPRRATPSGLNVALGHARGSYVARMDAHAVYPADYLRRGVERLEAGGTHWVSGLAIARGRGRVSRAVALALQDPLGRGGSRKWAAEAGADQEVELDSGVFAGVWARDTVLDYGGWDEHWLRNQDSEMAGRFLARGERLVLLPRMAADYAPRDSLGGVFRQYFGYGSYRTLTAARHPHTMRRSHLLAPAVVVAAASAVAGPRGLRGLARAGLAAYLAAIGLAGVRARRADPGHGAEAALVPAVLVAMHFGHGLGALREAVRSGFPTAALARVLGLSALAARLAPPPEPVYAPSLQEALAERAGRERVSPGSGTPRPA
jgi:succinoglycan biosynthesis protein ExoA